MLDVVHWTLEKLCIALARKIMSAWEIFVLSSVHIFYSVGKLTSMYSSPPIYGPPSYAATIIWNKPFINVFNLPLTSGHPSYTATIFIPQGWPHKRGTNVSAN